MDIELIKTLAFLCPMVFLAGFVDAIAGGGGLISMPSYIAAGLPMHQIFGCTKMQCTFGLFTSLVRFKKSSYLDKKTAIICAISAIVFAAIGTKIIILLPNDIIKKAITIALPIISFTMLFNPKSSEKALLKAPDTAKTIILSIVAGMFMGLYDSMIGPGGGTIGMLLIIKLFKYDYKIAAGNIKLILFSSNCISFLGYVLSGNMLYSVAIPITIANIIGSYIGSGFAIKHGKKIIKPLANAVVIIILIKYALMPLIF